MDKPSASMQHAPVFAAHIDPASSIIYANMEEIVFHLVVEGDGRYRFLLVNPAFEKATGLPPAQVVGKLVDEVIPEPSRTLVLAHYRAAIAGRCASKACG